MNGFIQLPLVTGSSGGDIWRGNGFLAATTNQLFLPQTGYYNVTAHLTLLSNSSFPATLGFVIFNLWLNGVDITTGGNVAGGNSQSYGFPSTQYGGAYPNGYRTFSANGIARCTTALTDYLSFNLQNGTNDTIVYNELNVTVFKISGL